jgi:hypothetical protein
MRTPIRAIAAISCAGALVLPSAALADESSLGGYGEVGGVSQTEVSGGGPAPGAPTTPPAVSRPQGGGSSLPFTGFDVLAVAAVGGLLAGAGVTLRRLSDRGDSSSDSG